MNSLLSSTTSVSKYIELEKSKDQKALAKFIRERFSERYIQPMRVEKSSKNGFTIMAVSCLMIETLESFFQGWNDTRNKSQIAFCNFFDRNPELHFIKGYSQEFYKHVRCGILHQAETTGGWHIRRDGKIFNRQNKTINAKKFHDAVESVLMNYCNDLETLDWNSELLKNFRKKMKSICSNCLPKK